MSINVQTPTDTTITMSRSFDAPREPRMAFENEEVTSSDTSAV